MGWKVHFSFSQDCGKLKWTFWPTQYVSNYDTRGLKQKFKKANLEKIWNIYGWATWTRKYSGQELGRRNNVKEAGHMGMAVLYIIYSHYWSFISARLEENNKNAVIPHLFNMVDIASHVIFPTNPACSLIILLHTFLWRPPRTFVIQGDVVFPIPNTYMHTYI